MKITGIICEYNPFHNGHLYQINKAKEHGSDYIIAVMSGNWMQRGTPAIIDKHTRAKMALECGVDLVLELPTVFSTSSALDFALGGVSLLGELGCVNELCFGVESDSKSLLKVTETLTANKGSIDNKILALKKDGYSYPKARQIALLDYLDEESMEFISKPNTILAIEYINAIKQLGYTNLTPYPVLRKGSGYNEDTLNSEFLSSATAIRNGIANNSDISSHVPPLVAAMLENITPIEANDFSKELIYKLNLKSNTGFTDYLDVSSELSDKIIKYLNSFKSFSQFCELLKSKDLTYTHISRALTHILLEIKKMDIPDNKIASYARVLGFRKGSESLFGIIKSNTGIPLVTKLADTECDLSTDLLASKVYYSALAQKSHSQIINEFTQQIIIV